MTMSDHDEEVKDRVELPQEQQDGVKPEREQSIPAELMTTVGDMEPCQLGQLLKDTFLQTQAKLFQVQVNPTTSRATEQQKEQLRRCKACGRNHDWKTCSKTRCFKCGGKGHIKTECKGRRNRTPENYIIARLQNNSKTQKPIKQDYSRGKVKPLTKEELEELLFSDTEDDQDAIDRWREMSLSTESLPKEIAITVPENEPAKNKQLTCELSVEDTTATRQLGNLMNQVSELRKKYDDKKLELKLIREKGEDTQEKLQELEQRILDLERLRLTDSLRMEASDEPEQKFSLFCQSNTNDRKKIEGYRGRGRLTAVIGPDPVGKLFANKQGQ